MQCIRILRYSYLLFQTICFKLYECKPRRINKAGSQLLFSVVLFRSYSKPVIIMNEFMFLCCSEVIADDTKAIDAVVNADKKRLALIEERQQLEAQKGKQGEHHGERLREVTFLM